MTSAHELNAAMLRYRNLSVNSARVPQGKQRGHRQKRELKSLLMAPQSFVYVVIQQFAG